MKNKTVLIRPFILFALLFIIISSSYGQTESSSNFDLQREIRMTQPDSQTRDIYLSIQKNTSKINLQILAEIKFGSLTIKIINPKKEIVGEFSIESQFVTEENQNKDAVKEIVSGRIQKIFNNPIVGKWIIKMDSDEVVGDVKFSSSIVSTD